MSEYELLDSGDGRKLERFGPYVLMRPCAQAVWRPSRSEAVWQQAHTEFSRRGGLQWKRREGIPSSWVIEIDSLRLRVSGTDFGHVGVFPEQRDQWRWIRRVLMGARGCRSEPPKVLNLFAYSGAATLAAALAAAEVCHVDASRGMVVWARENATLNNLEHAPIRWIVDDVLRFLRREIRRGHRYDAVILDPPSFGRGPSGEVFKIDRDIQPLMEGCRHVLSSRPLFFLLTCHTPGWTPRVLQNLVSQIVPHSGRIESGEMCLRGAPGVLEIPSGTFARWSADVGAANGP